MNKINSKLAIASAVLVLMAGVAHAEEVSVSNGAFKDLDALKTQNALLVESLKNAELKAKILEVGKPKGEVRVEKEVNRVTVSGLDSTSAHVMQVSGVGADLTALLSMSNGRQVLAHVGTNIAGLGVVKSISLNEVLVAAAKGRVNSLAFSGDAVAGNSAATMNLPGVSSMAMPPLPPSMMIGGR
jgi:type IV pilus biogenesis protein PilP